VGLGFAKGNDEKSNYERMKAKVNDELKKHFRPEFLNRIDDIIVFHQLTEEQIITMVDLMITRVEAQLANKDMAIELTPAAKALLARRGFDPVQGARPLRRTIQREIEDQLSEKILFGEIEGGQIVIVDVEDVNPDAPGRPVGWRQGPVHLPRRAEAGHHRPGRAADPAAVVNELPDGCLPGRHDGRHFCLLPTELLTAIGGR
jgi:hypothetical protein